MKEQGRSAGPLRFLAWCCLAAALVALVAVFPYTTSHLDHAVPLTQAAWHMWLSYPDFQHGMFVAPLAAGMVWLKRRELAALPRQGSRWGLAVFALGLLCFILGFLADIQYVGFFSLNILAAGLVLWFLGRKWMRAVAFPWAFLVFMWPIPFADNMVALPLRQMMSQGSHYILALLGLPNDCIGTAVVSAARPGMPAGGRFAIDVADPCSGIRSLFALLMISALYAHFTLDRTWKKWTLFLAAFPLAILGNMARLVLLVFGTLLFGTPFAIGSLDHPTWFHEGAGFAVFAVALGGMAGIARFLEGKGARSPA